MCGDVAELGCDGRAEGCAGGSGGNPEPPPPAYAALAPVTSVLSCVLAASAAVNGAVAVYVGVVSYMRVPFWDAWGPIDLLANARLSLLEWLWTQHNEHRIFTGKLFLLADLRWFQGRDILPRVSIFVVLAAEFCLMLWLARRWAGLRGEGWRTGAGWCALCVFWIGQWENFRSGFQISFPLLALFAALAVAMMQLYRDHPSASRGRACLAASLAAALIASYSLANGLLIWPLLLLMAATARPLRPGPVIATIVASAATWCSYLYHYHGMPGHSDPIASLRTPGAVLHYAAIYLGAPFANQHPGAAGMLGLVAGLAGIAIAGWTAWGLLLRRARDPLLGFIAIIILFYVGTAVETGLGRHTLGFNQALAGRYQTFSLWVWFTLGLLLVRMAARRSRPALLAIQIALLGGIGANLQAVQPTAAAARSMALSGDAASLAILTGVNDPETMRAVFPWPEFAWRNVPYLREHRLSVFADPVLSRLNGSFASLYRPTTQSCWAGLDAAKEFGGSGGRRLAGWAWDPGRRRAPDMLIFVVGGKIVGFGQGGFLTPQLGARLNLKRAWHAGWVGFVEPEAGSVPARAYSLTNRREQEACPLPDAAGAPVEPGAPRPAR